MLANSADARGVLNWNVVPKFHFLWHLGQKAQYSHPRKGNTMVDEDYVGLIKTVVHSCVWGTDQNNAPLAVAEKIRWGQHFAAVFGNAFEH